MFVLVGKSYLHLQFVYTARCLFISPYFLFRFYVLVILDNSLGNPFQPTL